ncbi:aldehyde dehydrogenase [Paenibacillus sp. PsM32]|uniref:aldehyde dehydrogenase n=1 Tax=unclassified Paenibacillus TaxID=185978 RepID=UPI00263B9064|nr:MULTISPECIES: aldehyde dehydrogenase [unclassified Paenibacillus]MDN4619263.1 aldehyde dehydrogenase [Paenibacillus sp. PsM32]MDQ1236944.1 aldehyde dehydrogenase (NAD+) [Paenibacillus sp. SORGH_AS_0306]MDR6109306.1 aldehyde dehydrogenase (NAD+) [Paenibacillus sp. SORGH_AS_0338]
MTTAHELVQQQRQFFNTGNTKDVTFRIQALNRLKKAIEKFHQPILDALKSDLNKSEPEAFGSEIRIVLGEIDFTLEHLEQWAAPREVPTASTLPDSSSFIHPEPYGVALIIAPWNYPFQLAFGPLVGAMAAGNSAVIKPSELTPAVSKVTAELIADTFPSEYIAVMEGEVETSTALLKEKFDYIFFTGSTGVGKVVMRAAAEHLTPVTLELGGKSPSIVHKDANLQIAAQRLARGKFLNAGQTCVAPDYLLVHEDVREEFISLLQAEINDKYTENATQNPNFPHIVNQRNFDRLAKFLEDGEFLIGGRSIREQLVIEPTLLGNVDWSSPVMQEEIFGPILPVIEYNDLTPILDEITNRPKPLALYLFTNDEEVQDQVFNTVSFGGGCVNETLSHMTSHYLPFGGVGDSGMGSYHGQQSFELFSHHKSILKRNS